MIMNIYHIITPLFILQANSPTHIQSISSIEVNVLHQRATISFSYTAHNDLIHNVHANFNAGIFIDEVIHT